VSYLTLELGHLQKVNPEIWAPEGHILRVARVETHKREDNARRFDGRMVFVLEGQADRSLARSAWVSATPKSRPVGHGLIRTGVRWRFDD
jgi:hypothetical protein